MANTPLIDLTELTSGQRQAYNAIMSGKNVFVSGYAGTGKSVLIHRVAADLRSQGKNVIVCAPTGIAARNINGMTIHAAFGYEADEPAITKGGGGKEPRLKNKSRRESIQAADVVIIDEISMVRLDFFDSIVYSLFDAERKTGRRKQLVVIGDFRQLPPVIEPKEVHDIGDYFSEIGCPEHPYAFLGDFWGSLFPKGHNFQLTEVKRTTDEEFSHMQYLASKGAPSCLPYFNARVGATVPTAIQLASRRSTAADINNAAIAELTGDPIVVKPDIEYQDWYLRKRGGHGIDFAAAPTNTLPEEIILKPQMHVIVTRTKYLRTRTASLTDTSITYNAHSAYYTNGEMGVIEDISDKELIIRLDRGCSVTIGKTEYPIYDLVTQTESGRDVVRQIQVGSAFQFPVLPAYCLTIHRAQGQSYDRVILSPDNFTSGQVYVGLSRARTYEGLSLTRPLTADDLRTDPQVEQFYKEVFGG